MPTPHPTPTGPPAPAPAPAPVPATAPAGRLNAAVEAAAPAAAQAGPLAALGVASLRTTAIALAWSVAFALVCAVLPTPAPLPGLRLAHLAAAGEWVWPLDGSPAVVRGFDPPPQPWMAGHRGVDLAGGSVVVRAAGAGTVRFAGVVVSRPLVSISHHDGLITTYEPVEPMVGEGEWVQAGQVIGTVQPGHPGCPAQVCLHWGLRRGETYLDPLILMGTGRVRLLPLARRAGRRRGDRIRPRCCRSAR